MNNKDLNCSGSIVDTTKKAEEGEILRELNRLQEIAEHIDDKTRNLESALDIILLPKNEDPAKGNSESCETSLGQTIQEENTKLSHISRRIQDLIRRLGI